MGGGTQTVFLLLLISFFITLVDKHAHLSNDSYHYLFVLLIYVICLKSVGKKHNFFQIHYKLIHNSRIINLLLYKFRLVTVPGVSHKRIGWSNNTDQQNRSNRTALGTSGQSACSSVHWTRRCARETVIRQSAT